MRLLLLIPMLLIALTARADEPAKPVPAPPPSEAKVADQEIGLGVIVGCELMPPTANQPVHYSAKCPAGWVFRTLLLGGLAHACVCFPASIPEPAPDAPAPPAKKEK